MTSLFSIDLGFLLLFVLKIDRPRKKNFLVKGFNKSAIKILFRKGLTNPLLKFLVKGLTKSVVKILIRKGLSNPSFGYFCRKGLTNPSKNANFNI